ncbi:hypothetical protein ASG17_13090 [Brevundimonas sp. Leaf363]|uniref:hypothetical protein n=1 Tax=Brevundimonas sp. Leaf363 TaxID=1736353 RepID=UPI0006FE0CDA|nr:hypothetical protein [Brevundimonas sp. Leaf363]KQS53890.1 hypothetical protein ASG17_13090 [Brevundimonas sp. Leaf363]
MFAFVIATALLTTAPATVAERSHPTPQQVSLAPEPVLSSVAVTLECTAYKDGRVGACQVLGETHPGLGFGTAAVALMQGERLEPSARDVQFARTIQFMP